MQFNKPPHHLPITPPEPSVRGAFLCQSQGEPMPEIVGTVVFGIGILVFIVCGAVGASIRLMMLDLYKYFSQ